MADESRAKPTAGPSADPADIFDTGVELFANLVKALRKAEGGAEKPRVPSANSETVSDAILESHLPCPHARPSWRMCPHCLGLNAAQPPSESLRECEGCSRWKPVDEMAVCFLPGTGESYQCEECRGGP